MANISFSKHGFSSRAAIEEKSPRTVSDWFALRRAHNSGSATRGTARGLCQNAGPLSEPEPKR